MGDQRWRESGERAGSARARRRATGHLMPRVRVPDLERDGAAATASSGYPHRTLPVARTPAPLAGGDAPLRHDPRRTRSRDHREGDRAAPGDAPARRARRPDRPPERSRPSPRRPAQPPAPSASRNVARANAPSSGSSLIAASSSNGSAWLAAWPGEGDLSAEALEPRALKRVERASSAVARRSSAALRRGRVELGPRGGKRACAAPRRVRSQLGRPLEERGRRRDAAPVLHPSGGAHPARPRPSRRVPTAARARCHARRWDRPSGSWPRRGHDARSELARAGRTAGGGADQWVPEPDPGADLDEPGRLGRGRASAPILSRWAARHNRVTSPTGSTAAVSRSRRVSGGSGASRRMEFQLDAAGERRRVRQSDPAPQLGRGQPAGQLDQRERVGRAGNDPRADPLVHRARDDESNSARASASPRPPTTRSGRPSNAGSPVGSRTAKTRATRSAARRRATNARASAETRSSRCASSTRQTSGRSSATEESSPITASPIRNRQAAPRRDGGRMPSRA